jgi:AraC-like DNA-binding protein
MRKKRGPDRKPRTRNPVRTRMALSLLQADRTLSPSALAKALGMSASYLRSLLSEAGVCPKCRRPLR